MEINKLHNIKTVYFDYDGTLHDSIKFIAPAFRKAYQYLVNINKAEAKDFTDKEIAKWLGYTDSEMWDKFMKRLELPYRKKAEEIIAEEMYAQVHKGNARLFENITKVLKKLKDKRYVLVFLSNCGKEYMESADKIFNLNCYFDDMVCSGIYNNKPKHEILSEIKNKYPQDQVMIGDRFHDIKTAQYNNIYSIFCEYGYGDPDEGKEANIRIKKTD
jgi:phosphoglycolate phosphatase